MKSIQITRDMVQNTADLQRILDQNAGAEVEIVLQEGQYDLDKGLCLRKEHAGMTVRGEGKVRLIGGKRLTGWKVAEDDRIAPEAKGTVLVCDLRENGIGDTKAMVSRGYGRAVVPSHSQLFIDGEPQRLTRYPKEDEFLTIAGVVDADVNEWGEEAGKLEAGFTTTMKNRRPGPPARISGSMAIGAGIGPTATSALRSWTLQITRLSMALPTATSPSKRDSGFVF